MKCSVDMACFFNEFGEYLPQFLDKVKKYNAYVRQIDTVQDVNKFYFDLIKETNSKHPPLTPFLLHAIMKRVFDSVIVEKPYLDIKLHRFLRPQFIMERYRGMALPDIFSSVKNYNKFLQDCDSLEKYSEYYRSIVSHYKHHRNPADPILRLVNFSKVCLAFEHPQKGFLSGFKHALDDNDENLELSMWTYDYPTQKYYIKPTLCDMCVSKQAAVACALEDVENEDVM